MSTKHTPGPWRWEYNAEHKSVNLVGGKPQYDLTVMDFARWGMGGAVPRFRDTSVDGMNLMDRLCDKQDWTATAPGREHHKNWFRLVTHPDARLMAAAPDLLVSLQALLNATMYKNHPKESAMAIAAIAKATGETQ